jgi:hypothetical protein
MSTTRVPCRVSPREQRHNGRIESSATKKTNAAEASPGHRASTMRGEFAEWRVQFVQRPVATPMLTPILLCRISMRPQRARAPVARSTGERYRLVCSAGALTLSPNDAIAKITGRNAGRRSRRSCGLAQCRNPVKKPIYRGSRFGNFRMCEVVHTLGGIELLTSAMRRSFFHRTASSAAHLSGSLLTKSKTWHIHYLGFQRWAASERIPLGNLFCNLRFADVRAPNRYTKRNGARCFADDRRYPARERGLPVDWSGWIHFR